MDLVDYSEERFDEIREEFRSFAMKLEVADLTFVPISALTGDNVVSHAAQAMPWYEGTSLLHQLEDIHIASDRNLIDARFPVQYVIRPQQADFHDFRGYAGTIAGGTFKPGDEVDGAAVRLLDDGHGGARARAASELDRGASPARRSTIELADDIDIARGDLICRPHNRPHIGQDIDAMVCWLTSDDVAVARARRYTIQHTTRSTRAVGQATWTTASTSTRCTATRRPTV